jgi:carboxyl-terminal processing protease
MAALVLLLSLQGCSLLPATAAETGVPPWQPVLASIAAQTLEEYHYHPPQLDDATSREWLDRYIDSLDYDHKVFLASDVEEFHQKYARRLDDDVQGRNPNLDAAFDIFGRYRERLKARVTDAVALIHQPQDYTVKEYLPLERDKAPFPANDAEARELWRLRIKSDLLQAELKGEDHAKYVALLEKRLARIQREEDEREPQDVLEIYLGALCAVFDPHSVWFKPASSDDFDIDLSNSVEGIGATLRSEDGYTIVEELVPGGPADLSGLLHKGDKIVAVAQGDGPPSDVVELRIDRVVKQIRGAKGTHVKLTIIPAKAEDPSETRVVEIVRDKVQITTKDAKLEVREIPGPSGTVKVGWIDVPSFYLDAAAREAGDPNFNSTTGDLIKLLAEARKSKVDVVAIDLRENGGGSLSEAVSVTGLFIDTGPVVQIRDSKKQTEVMADEMRGTSWDGPLVVYTSDLSASASEIFAGAIQDYGRGLIIGSPSTHGKGTVQTVMDLDPIFRAKARSAPDEPAAGALKLTTHAFYRISGASTQLEGVHADVVIPSPWKGYDYAEKDLDHALPFTQIDPVSPRPVLGTPGKLAVDLQRASDARIAQDQWFRWQADDVAEREARKTDPKISLNLAERQKEKADVEAKRVERGLPATPSEDQEEEGPTYILDESLRITADYVAAARAAAPAN